MEKLFRLGVASIATPVSDAAPSVVDNALAAIPEAGKRGVDLLLLPEETDIVSGEPYGKYALEDHPVFKGFAREAAKAGIGVVATLSAKIDGGHANTGFLVNRKGALTGVYRKKHPAPSEETILTTPTDGDPFPVFDFEGVKIGIGICMDIHFPEMFRIYGLKGADLICLSTMYLDYTGDMLESIEKARAIDSQVYFALSRYITKPFLSGKNMGYAKVIAPDGRIIASTGHQDGIAIAEIDPKWRMPFWGEGYGGNMRTMFDTIRRPDLYGELVRPKLETKS